jgi:hypothetical protein
MVQGKYGMRRSLYNCFKFIYFRVYKIFLYLFIIIIVIIFKKLFLSLIYYNQTKNIKKINLK